MKKSIETIAHVATVLGVLAAILFSGFQIKAYREDRILQKRPYIRILFEKSLVKEKTLNILGKKPVISQEKRHVYIDLDKRKETIELKTAFSLDNLGQYPASIEEITIEFSDINKTFTLEKTIAFASFELIIFQNDSFGMVMELLKNPENSCEGCFDHFFSEVKSWINEEDFIIKVLVKYKMFNDIKNEYDFKTETVVRIAYERKDAHTMKSYME